MKSPVVACSFDGRHFIRMPNGRLIDCGSDSDALAVAKDVTHILNLHSALTEPKEKPDDK